MDVSDNCRVTFNTKARVLTAADFKIVGDKKFTYDGTVHSVKVIPTSKIQDYLELMVVLLNTKRKMARCTLMSSFSRIGRERMGYMCLPIQKSRY